MAEDWDDSGLEAVPARAAEAAAALEGLKAPAREAADAIEMAFGRAGERLAGSLTRAAADGKLTLAELAQAVLSAVNAVAGSGRGGGLSDALAAALKGGFSGSRADGGPVLAGGAYLVGERGPEVFRPASSGVVESGGGAPVVVNVSVPGGTDSLLRSEAQIAALLARAVALGARRL